MAAPKANDLSMKCNEIKRGEFVNSICSFPVSIFNPPITTAYLTYNYTRLSMAWLYIQHYVYQVNGSKRLVEVIYSMRHLSLRFWPFNVSECPAVTQSIATICINKYKMTFQNHMHCSVTDNRRSDPQPTWFTVNHLQMGLWTLTVFTAVANSTMIFSNSVVNGIIRGFFRLDGK